jgi:hypothetical protein
MQDGKLVFVSARPAASMGFLVSLFGVYPSQRDHCIRRSTSGGRYFAVPDEAGQE